MITIYHLDTSRSERIVWLMEELGLPYRIEVMDRQSTMAAPDALRDIHPLGLAPVIRDGETVLAESGAIVEYIVARHGGGRLSVRPDAGNFARYVFWLHYAEGGMMLQLIKSWTLRRMLPDPDATPGMGRVMDMTRRHFGFVEASLGEYPYFAGPEFTAADVMMTFALTTLGRFTKLDLSAMPNCATYVARIAERPAYRRAMAAAGPDRVR